VLKLKNNYYFVVRFWTNFYDLSQLTASFSVNFCIITRPFGRDITLSLGWGSFRLLTFIGPCIVIQGAYKLSEDFANPYFHKYWTEIHYVAIDVCPTCDTADVQAILPFPPNPLKHVLCNVPDGSSDYRTIPNVTFTVCNRHEFHDLRHFLLKLWRNEILR